MYFLTLILVILNLQLFLIKKLFSSESRFVFISVTTEPSEFDSYKPITGGQQEKEVSVEEVIKELEREKKSKILEGRTKQIIEAVGKAKAASKYNRNTLVDIKRLSTHLHPENLGRRIAEKTDLVLKNFELHEKFLIGLIKTSNTLRKNGGLNPIITEQEASNELSTSSAEQLKQNGN